MSKERNPKNEASAVRVVTRNRKAHHDYTILDRYEAGIELRGTEVKSLRAGKVNLKDSYALVEHGEVFLHNAHISAYEPGTRFNHDPERVRKLLLHRGEIRRLIGRAQQQGLALVPLSIYFKNGRAKVELAVARGKKTYDKRESIARRDAEREMARSMKDRAR